jgi:DEAD/DEAH box helicase domain-containing protein
VAPNLTAAIDMPARPPQLDEFPDDLPAELVRVLRGRGIERPYRHQVDAWRRLRDGRHVVVVTPTASGKTLCYNVPVLTALLAGDAREASALYLFPTKALGQDQVAELNELLAALGSPAGAWTYDGDTPPDARRAIRERARVVVSNPDMVHTGVLPHHTRWVRFWQSLRYVVVDELHTYRGVFGSHVANVLRRLRRVAAFHGARPQFICCSATIANPGELATGLVGEPVDVVDENGAPRGARHFLFYNPPVVNSQLGIRASYLKTAARLAAELLADDVSTIVFALSRLNVEVVFRYVRDYLLRRGDGARRVEALRAYRGGYLPRLRRDIEHGLRSGEVRGVVATSALELGIDIGQLDASIIAGYPGSVASMWQQAGRAGRRAGSSLSVFVARSNPLDQFIVRNPAYFFAQSPEHGRINPGNLSILVSHMKCAAFELPFGDGEAFHGLDARDTEDVLTYLADHHVVHRAGQRWHWTQDAYPAEHVSLRSVSDENFVVVDATDTTHRVLAEVDYDSAPMTLHERAIYLIEGEPHHVDRLDWEGRTAYVRRVDPDYFTTAMTRGKVEILDVFDVRDDAAGRARLEHGEVKVTTRVVGFKKIRFHTSENVGYGDVDLPDLQMHTTACWLTPSRECLAALPWPRSDVVDGLLAVAYALHHEAALHLMCDPHDLGRAVGDKSARWFAALDADRGRRVEPTTLPTDPDVADAFDPTLFLYDRYPGGIGLSPGLFPSGVIDGLLRRARAAVQACPCARGCPSCVGPAEDVGPGGKEVALALLARLLADDAQAPDVTEMH